MQQMKKLIFQFQLIFYINETYIQKPQSRISPFFHNYMLENHNFSKIPPESVPSRAQRSVHARNRLIPVSRLANLDRVILHLQQSM